MIYIRTTTTSTCADEHFRDNKNIGWYRTPSADKKSSPQGSNF